MPDKTDNILYMPWVRAKQVALIIVPDSFDLKWWVEQCGFADAEAMQKNQAKLDSGEWLRTEITYPQLQGLTNMSYIYLGWRGQVRCRHIGTRHDLTMSVSAAMAAKDAWPEWGEHFKVGRAYQWCFADLQLVSQYGVPPFIRESWWNVWQPIIGEMSAQAPIDEEPQWKRRRYTVKNGILVPEQ